MRDRDSPRTLCRQFNVPDMTGGDNFGQSADFAHSTQQKARLRWIALAVLFSVPSAESAEYAVNYANAHTQPMVVPAVRVRKRRLCPDGETGRRCAERHGERDALSAATTALTVPAATLT